MADYELAKFYFGPGAKDLPELPKIDAPPYPKVAQFFKEMPKRGRRFSKTGRNCFNVLRTR
jgi:hypothetical protein